MTVRITKPKFNLREKLSELDKPSGIKGNELLRSDVTQDARDLISAGRKNYIINGDFQVSQRGDYTSATTASNQAYFLDRWTVDVAGVGATIQHKLNQSVGNSPSSNGNYYKNTVTMAATSSATGYLQLRQKMELHNSLFGKTVTVSAWVKSNHSNIRLRTEGGHVSGNWDSLQSHSGNGQWEKLSMTIPLTSSPSHLVFGIILWGSTGGPSANHAQGAISSGDYYEFTDYQVEIGENATDFEHRTIGEELELCKRYYQQIGPAASSVMILSGAGNGTQRIRGSYPLVPEMRVAPDVTVDTSGGNFIFYAYSGGAPSYTSLNSDGATTKQFHWDFNTSTHNKEGLAYDVKGSNAFIKLDSEL